MPLRFLLLCAVLHGQHAEHSHMVDESAPSWWLSYRFDDTNILSPRLLRELGIGLNETAVLNIFLRNHHDSLA